MTNLHILGSANFIDQVTNPDKLSSLPTPLDKYPELIHRAYEAIGATPLGTAIPEYAWYSTDVLRLMSWYSTARIISTLASSRSERTQRVFSAVTALTPAVIYELSQKSPDPKDIIAYVSGVAVAYVLDKKVSKKLTERVKKTSSDES